MPEYKKKSETPHYSTQNYNPDAQTTKEELEPSVKFVIDSWDDWDAYWGDKLNKFDDYYKRWKNKPPKRDEEWQSQFQKRLTWQAVATLVARYHSVLFPTSAPIEAEATEVQDEVMRIIAKSTVAHWFKLGVFTKEFLSGMRSAAIYGTGLYEDDWYVRIAEVTEKVQKQIPDFRPMVDMMGNKVQDETGNVRAEQVGVKTILVEEKKNKVVEDRYRVRKTSIFSWRIHPHKKTDDDDYPVIKQEFVTFEELKEMEVSAQERYGLNKFDNLDKLENEKFQINEQDWNRISKDSEFKDKKSPRIELLHYFGLYAEKDGKKKPMWICIANRKYKLWNKDNPYWHRKPPLTHIVWTEDEQESYYGIGLAETGGDAEDRANTDVNIRIDERKKAVRGGGWYNVNDKKIKKSDLQKNVPGLWRGCSDINASVRPDPPMPKSTMDDYKEEESAINDHREITGATSSLLPPADKNVLPDTLGGMQQNLSQALARLKPDLSMMEIMGIRRIANRAFLLTRQFMTLPQTIELIASEDQLKQLNLQKIYQLDASKLMQGINFFCTGLSESVDKIQNIDKALKLVELTGKINPQHPVITFLLKRISLWLGIEGIEEYLDANPMMPMMGQGMPPQGMPPSQVGGGQLGSMLPKPIPPRPMPPQAGGGQGIPPEIAAVIAQKMTG